MAGPSVTVEMCGDELKLMKSLQKSIDKNRELDKSLKDSGKSGEEASKKIDDGTKKANSGLDSAIGKVGRFAAGFASAGTAISLVKGVIDEMNKSLEESKRLSESLRDRRANLAAVATTNADCAMLEATSNRVAINNAMDHEKARELVYNARSGNFVDGVDTTARFARYANGDVAAVSSVATQVPQLFRGGITPSQALNATQAAATYSHLEFANLANIMPTAAQGGYAIGSSPAETVAMMGVLPALFSGNGSTAADRVKSFGLRLGGDERFAGLGFVGATQKLQGMSPEERSNVLGDSIEMKEAFNSLSSSLDQIQTLQRQVQAAIDQTGTEQSQIGQMDARYRSDPVSRALFERDQAKIARELDQEKILSAGALAGEAQSEAIRRQQQLFGANQAEIGVGSRLSDAASFLNPRLAPYGRMLGSAIYQQVSGDTSARPYIFPQSQQDAADAASQAVRKTLVDISQQSRGPSTLASPDVDR